MPLVEKSADKKMPIKSADKKAPIPRDNNSISAKTKAQMTAILASMKPGRWYRSSDFMSVIGVKETRTKQLLRLLAESGEVFVDGKNKWKRYQLAEK